MAARPGKTILITGATAGIGRYVATYLARRGDRVFAAGRNAAALETLRAEARAGGLAIIPLNLDVTDAASIEHARAFIDEATGGHGVDVLVNNAGYGLVAPLEMVDDADLRRQFETNVFGLVAVTRAFLPAMRRRGAGRIINVGSVGGRITFPFFGAYNATKYAVESLSDALRNEVAAFGVQVVLIEPGVIRSEFSERAMDTLTRYRSPDSPYAGLLRRADLLRARSDAHAVGPECVARAIARAIDARRPAARYIAPLRARALLMVALALPTVILDAIIRASAGLTRARLLPRATTSKAQPAPRALAS
jgi:NAD(P)-dependent dehydrogenase (short-subunit alcohol dehydrogenase family)